MRTRVWLAAIRDVFQRMGAGGVVALLLLVAALGAGLVIAPGLAADNRELAAQLEQLEARPAAPAGAAAAAPRYDPADPAAALWDQLPAADRFAPFVDALQAQAARRGVVIDRTEYRFQPVLGNRALRTQLILPAHGDYVRIRAWLEDTLHDFPSASLQELALHRVSEGSAQLDARVVIAFYTRSAK